MFLVGRIELSLLLFEPFRASAAERAVPRNNGRCAAGSTDTARPTNDLTDKTEPAHVNVSCFCPIPGYETCIDRARYRIKNVNWDRKQVCTIG